MLDGTFPCGKYVRLAVRRQVDDLARQGTDDFPYRFEEDAGAKVCRFMERLPHVHGPLAGELVTLEPWQCWAIIAVFGWYAMNGQPRFRRATLFMPKGQGKTFLGAGMALYQLGTGGKGEVVLSASYTKEQARLSFQTARLMMQGATALRDRLGLTVGQHAITQPGTGGTFVPVSGEARSLEGKIPSFILEDEIHVHPTREVHDNLRSSAAKRPDSRMVIISTAGFDTSENSIGYEIYLYARQILEGEIRDPSQFALLIEADEGSDPFAPATWRQANPNLGVSIDPQELANEANEARYDPRKLKSFVTKHLGWWVSGRDPVFDKDRWDALADAPDPATFGTDVPCYLGMDLASRVAFACLSRVFVRDLPHRDPERASAGDMERHYFVYVDSFTHEGAVSASDTYRRWREAGQLVATPGNTTEYAFIQKRLEQHLAAHHVAEIVSDPYEAAQLAQRLGQTKVPFVEYPQQVKFLSPALKEMQAALLDGRLHHDGNKVMRWMVGNVTAKQDANDNVFPRKERADQHIDGVSATLNAIGRSMVSPPKKRSVYETRGLVVLGGKVDGEDETPPPDPLARFRDVRFDSDDF